MDYHTAIKQEYEDFVTGVSKLSLNQTVYTLGLQAICSLSRLLDTVIVAKKQP